MKVIMDRSDWSNATSAVAVTAATKPRMDLDEPSSDRLSENIRPPSSGA